LQEATGRLKLLHIFIETFQAFYMKKLAFDGKFHDLTQISPKTTHNNGGMGYVHGCPVQIGFHWSAS
jgi:hypothetical protein